MSYTIKGKIHRISDEKQITDKFKVRDFVLFVENERNPEFSDYITLQFSQLYCDLLDKFEVGQEVEVKFDVKGRPDKKNENYFNTLAAWKIDFVGVGEAPKQQAQRAVQPKQQPPIEQQGVDDDLPF